MCAKQYHTNICQYCGKEYVHWNGRSKYCSGPHYTVCEVCGKKFEFDISRGKIPACCSKECTSNKRKATCVKKYGVEVASKDKNVRNKLSLSGKNSIAKRNKTCLHKYGVENPAQCKEVSQKISSSLKSNSSRRRYKSTSLHRYGTEHPMQNTQVFNKHAKASKKAVACDGTRLDSLWEQVVYDFLVRNDISFERQIPLTYKDDSGIAHVTYIDFCIDGILFEVKGGHFLDGVFEDVAHTKRKLELYKNKHVVVITDRLHSDVFRPSNGLKYVEKCHNPLIGVDIALFAKDCSFPYRDNRPKEFYYVRVSGQQSSYDAFYDEHIRWNMIINRIMYIGGFIDAKSVLTAMNVTRTCKQPSWFSKAFAKYIVQNFITSDVVVDPFAGWGARYDACVELGKLYIGCDINENLVQWHNSQGRHIRVENAKTFKYDKPCSVFICPPYQDTEIYTSDQDCSLTQCQWLSIVMNNVPNASEYVMVCKVVDDGWEKYIVDKKINKSHFGVNTEYVLCVPGRAAKNFKLDNSDIDELRKQAALFNSARRIKSINNRNDVREHKVWMANTATNETKMVSLSLVEDMKNLGWVKGRGNSFSMSHYVWINNCAQNKRVPKCDVHLYLENGWVVGRTVNSSKGIVYIHKDSKCIGVRQNDIDAYLSKGWIRGNGTSKKGIHKGACCGPKDKVCVNNGTVHKFIQASEVSSYLEKGWIKGRIASSLSPYWMHNDLVNRNIRVKKEEIPLYELQCWVCGQAKYK